MILFRQLDGEKWHVEAAIDHCVIYWDPIEGTCHSLVHPFFWMHGFPRSWGLF